MGKRTKLREAQRRAEEQAMAARLRAHSRADTGPSFITSYCDFDPHYRDQIEAYRGFALRAPEDWQCRLRCRSPERRFLELVEFTFARYPVALHLKHSWIAPRDPYLAVALTLACELPDLRRWYIIAAQGHSFHKEVTQGYLSKLETHYFLNTPVEVTTPARALWYALARAQTDHVGVAFKIARSKLIEFPLASPFWREVARFFARHSMTVLEMNDLIDYLRVVRQEDPGFSLKGRTLPALRRRAAEWHRALADSSCGGRWKGHRLADAVYPGEYGQPIWRFRQIKTGEELAHEGRRMAHCVATYKDQCMRGESSIWSLSCEHPDGEAARRLTLEVASDRTILQCRGFANRSAGADEIAIVQRWAAEHGLTWEDWAF